MEKRHRNRRAVMPLLLFVTGVLTCAQPLRGQALRDPEVEGILFIKRHSFTDSSSGAWPVEYRDAASNDKIIVITTREGKRLRLLVGQVPDIIPYPGRGNLTRTEGLVLCELALKHYPQHRLLLTNIRNAWRRMSPVDYQKYREASKNRIREADKLIAHMEKESERITSHRISGAWIPSATLLDRPAKNQASSNQTAAAPSSREPTAEPDTEEIRELQRQLEQLSRQ